MEKFEEEQVLDSPIIIASSSSLWTTQSHSSEHEPSFPPFMTPGLLTKILPLEFFSLLTPFLEDTEAARLLVTEAGLWRRFWLDLRVLAHLQGHTGCLGNNYPTYRRASCLFSRVAAVKEMQMWWRRRGLLAWLKEVVSDARRLSEGLTRTNFRHSMTSELGKLVPFCPCCSAREIDVALYYPAPDAWESLWELFVGCRVCTQSLANIMLGFRQERWEGMYLADLGRGPYRLTSVWNLLD